MNKRDFSSDQLPALLSGFERDKIYDSVNPYENINDGCFTYAGRNHQYNYKLTYFMTGRITYVYLPPHYKGISFGFTGCAMAYFKFKGSIYVAHIYLSGLGIDGDCGKKWNDFIRDNKKDIGEYVIFKPFSGERLKAYMNKHRGCKNSIVGIITPRLHCYSVVTDNNYNPLYMIERKKRIRFSNNLSLESSLDRFKIPPDRENL